MAFEKLNKNNFAKGYCLRQSKNNRLQGESQIHITLDQVLKNA